MNPTPHPLLPLPTQEEVACVLAQTNGQEKYLEWLNTREKTIQQAERDPLWFGFEPRFEFADGEVVRPWKDCDELYGLEDCDVLGIFGGNRAGKSYYAAKRMCQAAMMYSDGRIVCLAETEKSSIATQQQLVWHFLRPHFEVFNGKRSAVTKIVYTQANGFTDGKLVLPNRTEIYFLTYGMEAGEYEGWEFGAPRQLVASERQRLLESGKFAPPNIGAWADESMPLSWLQMFSRRLKWRKAKLAWTFTPVKGITPAVKELVGSSARTVMSLPSELLAERKNLPDLPVGHMPYIQETSFLRSRAIYFFSILNPFGDYYPGVKEACAGKSSELVERIAYGYARDSMARAFPKFGSENVVKVEHLPEVGTNYMLTDPAGTRNWATIWVRVTGDNPPCYYIYRDWPDEARYGEWAVATERETSEASRKGWDGDRGPAQNGLGFGVFQYKRLFLDEERIVVPQSIVKRENLTAKSAESAERKEEELRKYFVDPYRRAVVRKAILEEEDLSNLRERIQERQIDSRAGRNEHVAEKGGTCLVDEFARPTASRDGKVTLEPMYFALASGVSIDEGITEINGLLDWDKESPMVALMNAPRLFVSENCRQVRWAMENYTGLSGETGACKDFVDLVRYMAMGRLRNVEGGKVKTRGGGAY